MVWSVARSTSFTGSFNPLQFTIVLVNEGGAWQTSTHRATITRAGFYFFHLGGGLPAGVDSWLHVLVNNITVLMLGNTTKNSNGVDTAGRCGILHLSAGAVVHSSATGNGFFSDNQMQTIFIGFLLYE